MFANNAKTLLLALLDAGADIEAPGAVFDGGTPLADAVSGRRRRLRAVEGGTAPNRTRGPHHPLASGGSGLAVTHPRLLSGHGTPGRGSHQQGLLVCLPRRTIQRCDLPPE